MAGTGYRVATSEKLLILKLVPQFDHPPPLFSYNAPASQKFQSQIGSEIPLNCIPRSVVCSGKVICCKNFLNSEPFLLPLQKLID